MIACNSVQYCATVAYTFVEGIRAGKDVVHARNPARVMDGGKTSEGSIFFRLVMEEGVLYKQSMGGKNMEKVLPTGIAARNGNAMWAESFTVFVAGVHTYPHVDITTHHNLCIWADDTEYGVKERTKLVIAIVVSQLYCTVQTVLLARQTKARR
jgi:hypothetical protein